MVRETPHRVHGRDLRPSVPRRLPCGRDAAAFGEQGGDDPGVIFMEVEWRARRELGMREREGGEEAEGEGD
jgi:hypothetical protein